jgi:hypothetical protein
MNFKATKQAVYNRGIPPDDFLTALVAFGKTASDGLFAPNANYDIYAVIEGTLGPWTGMVNRRAAMLEAMRVHAGFESSWNWDEGVDTTNAASMADIEQQETGVFQVSADSMGLDASLRAFIVEQLGTDNPQTFIEAMKEDHALAIDYYARLVRISVDWAGPLISIRGNPPAILRYLSEAAVTEFERLIATAPAIRATV